MIYSLEETFKVIESVYNQSSKLWVVKYSGGKDSSATLQLILEFLNKKKNDSSYLTKQIYIIMNDVLVDNPLMRKRVDKCIEMYKDFIKKYDLPVDIKILKPDIKETFWVKIIGYGYPPPTSKFRWCTDVLKIKPTHKFMEDLGEKALVITGERYSEGSTKRKLSMQKRAFNKYLAKAALGSITTFSPISQWSTNMVWWYLLNPGNRWQNDNEKLYELYKNASGEDCPEDLPSLENIPCGNSRFGCWTCTVVSDDKSALSLINKGKKELACLYNFRRRLKEYRQLQYRKNIRRNGEEGPGPIHKEFRRQLLEELLKLQKKTKFQVILPEEIAEIERIWTLEGLPPYIMEKVFKGELGTMGHIAKKDDELLKIVCKKAGVNVDIVRQVLAIEADFYAKRKRYGIYKKIREILELGLKSETQAVKNSQL
ncbi:MAG TPA: DNA phosphorothioation system sulfurtransferase DndC [Candidatus Atribacteria bacterium]|nr:MAG: DNA phosphorothioation system sulfurtransferase DndC [Thermodesulfobacteriota bacterium]HDK27922.1 DNA phosphorothioation system sulfurtransferase DndC [Candidatus Atribacteria bacterium]